MTAGGTTTPLLRLVGAPKETMEQEERTEVSDGELVGRALAGDRWAEEALYRRHAARVTNAVTRVLGRHADADDVVQDTFLRAFERLGTLQEPDAFRGWVTRIAVNLVRQRLRRRGVLRWLSLDADEDAALHLTAVDGTRPDLRAELEELAGILRRLPTEQRLVWVLHRVEGWSLRETAEAVAASTATVKRRLSAADSAIEVQRTGRGWTA